MHAKIVDGLLSMVDDGFEALVNCPPGTTLDSSDGLDAIHEAQRLLELTKRMEETHLGRCRAAFRRAHVCA